MRWLNDVEPRPALVVLPPAAASLDEAHEAIELWEFYSRKTLDPPQRLAVEIMMAEAPSGRWAARTTGREMPRQNGKGDEIEVVEFYGLTQRGEAILHTAHELNTVSSAHQRMVALLSHRDFSGRRKPKILNGLGQQSITMGDAVIQYRTRTAGGGRGLDDISRLVVDEAQHARPEQLASATPTLLANPNPQMNFAGTGGIAGVSDWWWELRRRAIGANPGDFGYLGHTVERVHLDDDGKVVQEPVDPLDRSRWPEANPALVYGRTEYEFLEEQLRILGPALFAREHLGVWDPPSNADGGWHVIPKESWASTGDPAHRASGPLRFALEVDTNARGETWASIGASDGTHLEVVTPPPGEPFLGGEEKYAPGTSWVVPVCKRRAAELGELLVVKGSPAEVLVGELEAAGVRVRVVTEPEFVDASMQLDEALRARTVRHIDQPVLNAAVAAVKPKAVADGKWRFSRTLSAADVGPLCAVAVARWGAVHSDQLVLDGSLMA